MKKFRVRITHLPTARTGYQVQGALVNDVPAMGGNDYNAYIGKKPKQDSKYLTAVPRDEANLEAEDGETAFGDINGDGFPEHKIIKGKRHYEGGVPLNLPDGTFIFSDTKSMKISDCTILKMFSKPCGKQSYTPAELAKPYDINKYRTMLEDPDTDEMTRKTAELMIKKYVIKLGALALAQESKKGFPQGIPEVAYPYMESVGLTAEDILPRDPNEQQQEEMSEANQIPQMPNDYEQPMQDQPDGSAPTQMPNGEPIAQPDMGQMPQGMSQEMMQQAPMAAYGMQMGGFDFPYSPNEMAYGGLTRAQDGVEQGKFQTKARTEGNIDYNTPEQTKQSQFQGANYKNIWVPKVEAAFADRKRAEDLVNRLETYEGQDFTDVRNKLKGKSMDEKISIAKRLATDNKVGPYHYVINDLINPKETVATEPEKPAAVTPGVKEKDRCYCPDPNDPTKQVEVECPEDDSEPICGERNQVQNQYGDMGMPQAYGDYMPQRSIQDDRFANALRNERHSKEYPYMPDLQVPEMEGNYVNWLAGVQGQLASEFGRSNEVRRMAGNSATKQAVLTQMQSQPEFIIAQTNMDNSRLKGQVDSVNFNARDKNITNRGNINKNYIGELGTLNQGWNNEINDWNYRKTLQENQGDTNAVNRYNMQTEQYAIHPRTGVGLFKQGKLQKPEEQLGVLDKLMRYKQSGRYPGIDDKTLLAAINSDAGNSGFTAADRMYGFSKGGFVYADIAYPFIF
jgi:hypothetical protein